MIRDIQHRQKRAVLMHPCPLTRWGLRHLLTTHLPDFTVQASGSFHEMEQQCEPGTADLVVSDLCDEDSAPSDGMRWLLGLQHRRGERPLVVISQGLRPSQYRVLSLHPMISLLALQTAEPQLIQHLHAVLVGQQVISPLFAPLSTGPAASYILTRAELVVLALLYAGYNVTQIACRLNRSIKTVSTHKRHVMHKLRVDNEIALFARISPMNDNTCLLDNGQYIVKYPYGNAVFGSQDVSHDLSGVG